MAGKLDGFLRPYRGGMDDLDSFWKKIEVVAGLQKWNSAELQAANLPLFLEGEAFSIWSELSSDDQKDPSIVRTRMIEAFGITAAQAYRQFAQRCLRANEAIENYAAGLKRLLVLSGLTVSDDGKNRVLIEQFITGLPADFARQLRLSGKTNTIHECVDFVRMLRSAERAFGQTTSETTAAVRSFVPGAALHSNDQAGSRRSVLCFRCNETGHIARYCPSSQRLQTTVQCYFCEEEGHVMRDCVEFNESKRQRKMKKERAAAAITTERNAKNEQ